MKAHIMHLKPAFMLSHSSSFVCWVGLGERGCLGNSKGYLAFEWVEPVCECTYVPQLPVFPVSPVRLQGHTYANQALAALPNTAFKECLGRFFVFHCTWITIASHWKWRTYRGSVTSLREFDLAHFIHGTKYLSTVLSAKFEARLLWLIQNVWIVIITE